MGQPVATAGLLISVLPLRLKAGSEASPDEQLEHVMSLKGTTLPKGSTKTLKYGPVCRAGAHCVSVTLNGAHIVGSPLQVTVGPAAPEARMCELRPYGSPAGGAAAANAALAAAGYHGAPPSGIHTHSGEATSEITLAVQLRDRYGNKCADANAAELAAVLAGGALRVIVQRQRASADRDAADAADVKAARSMLGGYGRGETDFDPGTHEPRALLPPSGSPAYEERVSTTITVAADEVASNGAAVDGRGRGGVGRGGSSGRGGSGGRGSARARRDDQPAVAPKTGPIGLLTVRLRIARAGVHLVSCAFRGELLQTMVVLMVKPGMPTARPRWALHGLDAHRTASMGTARPGCPPHGLDGHCTAWMGTARPRWALHGLDGHCTALMPTARP